MYNVQEKTWGMDTSIQFVKVPVWKEKHMLFLLSEAGDPFGKNLRRKHFRDDASKKTWQNISRNDKHLG